MQRIFADERHLAVWAGGGHEWARALEEADAREQVALH